MSWNKNVNRRIVFLWRSSRARVTGERLDPCLRSQHSIDDDDCIGYLNDWDRKIPNLDVVDDYRNEKREIQARQGKNFPFSFGDVSRRISSDGTPNCCLCLVRGENPHGRCRQLVRRSRREKSVDGWLRTAKGESWQQTQETALSHSLRRLIPAVEHETTFSAAHPLLTLVRTRYVSVSAYINDNDFLKCSHSKRLLSEWIIYSSVDWSETMINMSTWAKPLVLNYSIWSGLFFSSNSLPSFFCWVRFPWIWSMAGLPSIGNLFHLLCNIYLWMSVDGLICRRFVCSLSFLHYWLGRLLDGVLVDETVFICLLAVLFDKRYLSYIYIYMKRFEIQTIINSFHLCSLSIVQQRTTTMTACNQEMGFPPFSSFFLLWCRHHRDDVNKEERLPPQEDVTLDTRIYICAFTFVSFVVERHLGMRKILPRILRSI